MLALLLLTAAGFFLYYPRETEEVSDREPVPAPSQQVSIDGETFELQKPVYLIGDVVMVPMRELFEAAGAEVVFYPYREQAVARVGQVEASVRIGQRHALIEKSPYRMDRSSMVIEGSMYVPIDLAEKLP